MLSRERCRELFDIALSESKSLGVPDLEVLIHANAESLTRFANNAIHQNVFERGSGVSIRPQEGLRTARSETNRLDPESIRAAVRDAVAMMRAREDDPSLLPMADAVECPRVDRHDAGAAVCTPAQRGREVAEAISIVEGAGQTAAGIYSTAESVDALLNSRGCFVWHPQTLAVFSITAIDGAGSGWAKGSAVRLADVDPMALARSASRKAALSREPREIDPGHYTAILEPAAVLDLVGQLFPDFTGTAIEDQRSFLTDRLGAPLFGANITIHDDVFHPLQAGTPFDGEGMPRQRLTLVDKGTPAELCWSRQSAARQGREGTGHGLPLPNEAGEMPLNIAIEGGDSSVERMVAESDRAIQVTRLWYIREVDPYDKIMTGMTRDGTFLVEGGEPVCAVRNFRFNQGLVEMLRQVEALGPAVRASGEETFDMVVPAMKVAGFHFNEVTKF